MAVPCGCDDYPHTRTKAEDILEAMSHGQVRSAGDRRLRPRVSVECLNADTDGCAGTFDVMPSRVGTARRCPACVEASRYRCGACGEVFLDPGRPVGGFHVCTRCREEDVGPRGGRVPRPAKRRRVARIVFDCRGVEIASQHHQADGCFGSCQLTEAEVRVRLRSASSPDTKWGTSLDPKTRTYVCRACAGLPRLVTMARSVIEEGNASEAVLDELDRLGFYSRKPRTLAEARRVLALVRPPVPEPPDPKTISKKRAAKRKRVTSMAARGTRRPVADARRVSRIAAGKWRRGTGITVARCLWPPCGQLVFSHRTQRVPTELHRPCMVEAMRDPVARDWLGRRKRARDAGMPPHMVNRSFGVRLPITGAIRSDGETMTRNFRWTVLHLLGGDPQSELARDSGVTQQAVSKGIASTVELLPEGDKVSAPYKRLVAQIRRVVETRST